MFREGQCQHSLLSGPKLGVQVYVYLLSGISVASKVLEKRDGFILHSTMLKTIGINTIQCWGLLGDSCFWFSPGKNGWGIFWSSKVLPIGHSLWTIQEAAHFVLLIRENVRCQIISSYVYWNNEWSSVLFCPPCWGNEGWVVSEAENWTCLRTRDEEEQCSSGHSSNVNGCSMHPPTGDPC